MSRSGRPPSIFLAAERFVDAVSGARTLRDSSDDRVAEVVTQPHA